LPYQTTQFAFRVLVYTSRGEDGARKQSQTAVVYSKKLFHLFIIHGEPNKKDS
jgi:hypothetical protein